ncbi:MAG: hypothetical protein ACRC1H_15420, partial [Caldilineaceae bacterium]
QNKRVARIAFKELWGIVQLVWVLVLLAGIEGYSRLMGWYDFAIKRDRHVVWDMAWSQKQNIQGVRDQNHQREESFVVQARTQAERKKALP